jgi:hypothetical protein
MKFNNMSNKFEHKLAKAILNEKFLNTESKPKITNETKRAFMEAVGNFHEYGKAIYREGVTLKELSEEISEIIEIAEGLTLQESEHWFDNVTVSRHMKQLKEAQKTFEKTAMEMNEMQQRLEAAYDDMGAVLNRYYKVNEALK